MAKSSFLIKCCKVSNEPFFKGAQNTTDSDVKECGDHAGTHRFAVQCLVFELLISEDSNLSYRLTNHSAAAKQVAEKFEYSEIIN